ncbi:MarR family winged helix-turn-helix transcriptional regulator [Altererythrobacter arenosus]|uniref:MarR family winged helix-turn-helix transcriptional regulator n=1 Tax=Altererythrobacter arenosus TaxID=3032592 RepID=A0ABY8FXR0_9SPHN|nr:MarR family winged helix-turn-helix transcriptional regulator [Altererythrobacter sp. CAU 1644]WFL78051.1 MarR family winged helix-turn-helix transcriptional regulator [Altererythrobacter sp. CAU 1644]
MTARGNTNGRGRLADFLPYQLSVTSNAVSSLIAQRYRARFGLKITEWRVMAILGDAGEATQRELTEATLMDKVAVNRACKMLEERGLVARQPNSADGRSHHLVLTGEGRAIHGEIMPLALEIEREIFSALEPDEREKFRAMLRRIFDQAENTEPASRG